MARLAMVPPPDSAPAASDAPIREADIDRIIDVYGHVGGHQEGGLPSGGAGAYCYYGAPRLARLGNTELESWADSLLQAAASAATSGAHQDEDFRLVHEGRPYRVLCEDEGLGKHVSLRRLPKETPRLETLLTSTPAIRTLLEAPWLNDGGLVLFAGLTGQGKTTWAGATVRTRLEAFGGRCITVEDVVEMPLEGLWEGGSCRQITVDYRTSDPFRRGFTGAIRRAYRSMPATRPAMLLVGEVRDAETAEEVVKAAANGMLVLSTIHASDPIAAIMRLWSLAERSMGAEGASSNLAHGLRMVVHQSVTLAPTLSGWRRGRYSGSALISVGPTSGVGHLIRDGKLNMLGGELAFQANHINSATFNQPPASALLHSLCRGRPGGAQI